MKKETVSHPSQSEKPVTLLTKQNGAWSEREKWLIEQELHCGLRTHSRFPAVLILLDAYTEKQCRRALLNATAFTHEVFPSRNSPRLPFAILH